MSITGSNVPSLSQALPQGDGPDAEPRIPSEFFLLLECGKGVDPALAYAPALAPLPEVLQQYAEKLGIPFRLCGTARRYAKPVREEAIHVHHFALPTPPVLFGIWPRILQIRLPFAFGYPLAPAAQHAFPAGPQIGRGLILRDQDGHAVAEVATGNLYVLFNLLGQEGELRPLLLRRLLDASLPCLLMELRHLSPLGPETLQAALDLLGHETEELAARWHRQRQSTVRQAYLRECRSRLQQETAFLEQEMHLIEENLEEYGRRITAETRRLCTYHDRLNTLRGIPAAPEATLRELDQLKVLPDVRAVEVEDGRITVFTVPLEVEYDGRPFQMGSFRIEIAFAGDVRIRNLTHAVGAYDHPHIYQGRPCFGNIREGIAKMIGEYQFVAVVYVLLDFLKTVNPKDWRIPIVYWQEGRS